MTRNKKTKEKDSSSPGFPKALRYSLIAFLILCVFGFFIGINVSFMINSTKEKIRDYLDDETESQVSFGQITGGLFTGFKISDVKFWSGDEDVEPAWDGKKLILKIQILQLLKGKVIPKRIILDGFVFRFEQNPDGTFNLPTIVPSPSNAQGGMFIFRTFRLDVRNSQVEYRENPDFVANPITLKLDKINARGKYLESGRIVISSFKSEFAGSSIEMSGDFSSASPYQSDLKININDLNISFFAGSLARLFPSEQSLLPSGGGSFDVKLTGSLLDPKIKGKCRIESIKFGDFHVDDAIFIVDYTDKTLSLSDGIAKAYKGRINLSGSINANQPIPEFTIDANVKGVDIGEYLKSLGKGLDPVVFGSFDGSFRASGNFLSKDSVAGNGNLSCKGGLYLNPFKDTKLSMFSTRQEKYMEFIELDIVLGIENSGFVFDDIAMKSKWIDLDAKGNFGFDWSADFDGTVSASTELMKSAKGFADIAELLSKKSGRIPVRFLFTGAFPNYVFHTAIPEETINQMFGDDETRRRMAYEILQRYFGEQNSDLVENLVNQ